MGRTCTHVNTTRWCGSTHVMRSGDAVTVDNHRRWAQGHSCAYLFKAPPQGHILRLRVDQLDVANCSQYLDIRNNAVGQQSPIRCDKTLNYISMFYECVPEHYTYINVCLKILNLTRSKLTSKSSHMKNNYFLRICCLV